MATVLALFMAAVESTIVATAMPTIVGVLGGFDLFSWVFAAYLLTQAVTIPVYGRLADLYGRKRVLIIGIAIFLAGSALCGFAWSMPALIAFRAMQGLGGGAIMPVAFTIIGDIYTPAERARVQGLLASVWGVSAVTGPLLGAFLVEHVSWATIFWVNIPIGVATVALLLAAFHEKVQTRPHSIDYLGSILLMGGSGALILAIVQASVLGLDVVLVLVGGGILALAGLVFHEGRTAEPMMPLDLWRNRMIAAVNIGGLITGAVMMATTVFLPTYVQGVMGYSPVVAGFCLTALSVGWPVGATVSGRIMLRASYRAVVLAGCVALVIGAALLFVLDPARSPVWAGAAAFFTGLGMGFTNTVYVIAAQDSVERDRRGIATSGALFMRMLGQAVGAALYGGILNAGLARRLPDADGVVNQLMDPGRRATLDAATIARLSQAVADSLHLAYLVGIALALGALLVTFAMPHRVAARASGQG